jgi:hypothetical protein
MPKASAALIVLLLVLSAPAYAAQSAQELYVQGNYGAAISAAEAEGGASGFSWAARASLADAELRDQPCMECLSRAEELARSAIAADPQNAENYIFLVTALGRRARIIGFIQSQRESIAGQTRNAITQALEIDTHSVYGHAALGAWHLEVVHQAGSFLARALYGARAELGKSAYEEAIALEPENLVVRYQYALSLDAYDFEGEREVIEENLEMSASAMPRNAYENAIKARAEILLAMLQEDMIDAYRARARVFRGESVS